MGIDLKRNLTGLAALDPGEWCSDPGEVITVHLCCPLCSSIVTLDSRHVIARDGRVTPAVSCKACPFLDWVTLTGWGEAP